MPTEKLVKLIGVWRDRVKATGFVRGSDEYGELQNEFFLGASMMASLMGYHMHPIVIIYIMCGRDMLDLEGKLREQLA